MPDRRDPVFAEVGRVPGEREAHGLGRAGRHDDVRRDETAESRLRPMPPAMSAGAVVAVGKRAGAVAGPSSRPRAHRTSARDKDGSAGWSSGCRWRGRSRHSSGDAVSGSSVITLTPVMPLRLTRRALVGGCRPCPTTPTARVGDLGVGRVGEGDLEHRDRDARIAVVERDERVEGGQRTRRRGTASL